MGIFTTSEGRRVPHCHLGQTDECEATPLSAVRIARMRNIVKRDHPNAVEVMAPTNEYNCVGFALARSHGWFNFPEPFFTDDYDEVSFNSPAKGDVVRYNRSSGAFGHIAVVTQVSNGQITRLQSKWGKMAVLSHTLTDVDVEHGEPVALLRAQAGVVPFVDLIADEEMPEPVGVAPSVALGGGEEMPEFASTEEAIQWAVGRISDPDVYIRVALASTPEMARVIIAALPGVKELIDIGAKAAPAVLDLLRRAEEQQEPELSSVALYLLQRIPTEEAASSLADSFIAGRFTGLNLYLAADALLIYDKTETTSENSIAAAFRTAEKFKSQ
jgi:hypothetical protein